MATLRSNDEWSTSWLNPETPINWEVAGNPKRSHGKSHARFENYFGASTVGEYLSAGGTKGDLRYDWAHQFLSLGFQDGSALIIAAKTPSVIESDPDRIIEKALEEYKRPRKTKAVELVASDEEILS